MNDATILTFTIAGILITVYLIGLFVESEWGQAFIGLAIIIAVIQFVSRVLQ